MSRLRNIMQHEHFLIFICCLAVICGPVIITLFQYDLTFFIDCKTYLGLAEFDFHQNAVRRYRVIVPFIAAGINFLFGGIFEHMAPAYFKEGYPLALSFCIVNSLLTSFYGLLIYRYCKGFGLNKAAAFAGALVMLTCRYTSYMAALSLVDSLFCVTIALTLCGIKLKNDSMLIWAIFLGPFAKEAYIFIAPLLFFSHMKKTKLLLLLACSGLLIFGFRYIYDVLVEVPNSGYAADVKHVTFIARHLKKLISFHMLGLVAMNVGLWGLLPVLAYILRPAWIKDLRTSLDGYLILFVASVILQVLLSGNMERMLYLVLPAVSAVVALAAHELITRYVKPEVVRGQV